MVCFQCFMNGKRSSDRKNTKGKELIKGLQELVDVVESGEPLEDHFRVTTIEKVNEFENVVTVKGPKKSENDALQDGKIE